MSDKPSNPTPPSTPSKPEKKPLPSKPVSGATRLEGPDESQVSEPPPGGGQQPGDHFDKAPPTSNR
jgi:hypothetical protein